MKISNLIIVICVIIASLVLQVYLSKREDRWAGLIIPIFLAIITVVAFIAPIVSDSVAVAFIEQIATLLCTAVYFAIYFVCRSKVRRKKQLDKMNINDLG